MIDQEARDLAHKALSQIDGHEDICAVRYEGIQCEIKGIKATLKWAGGACFSIIISALGFLAVAQFNANDQARRDMQSRADAQQRTIELLQQQLAASRKAP